MNIAVVILNENQELYDEQKQMLGNKYEITRFMFIPEYPTEAIMRKKLKEVRDYISEQNISNDVDVVFASSVPFMLKELTHVAYVDSFGVRVFHNDNIPHNEPTGWVLI